MSYSIRSALAEDALEISLLICPLVEEFISFEYTKQGAQIMLKSMSPKAIAGNIAGDFDYLVAEINDKIVGVLGIKQKTHLFHCFVDKNNHRKQLGSLLWNNWLETSQAEKVTVNSSRYAIRFYQRLGFYSDNEIFEKNGVTCYPMTFHRSKRVEH